MSDRAAPPVVPADAALLRDEANLLEGLLIEQPNVVCVRSSPLWESYRERPNRLRALAELLDPISHRVHDMSNQTPTIVPADAALLRDAAIGEENGLTGVLDPAVVAVGQYRAARLRALADVLDKITRGVVNDVRSAGLAAAYIASYMPLSSEKWEDAHALNQRVKAHADLFAALLPPE